MPKILITGNGFDLSYGLPTSYSDFINILEFINKNTEFEFDTVYSKSSNYKTLIQNFNKFDLEKNEFDILKKLLNDNKWFIFFQEESKIETWIDFENKIEYVLEKLFQAIEIIKNVFSNGGSRSKNRNLYNHETFLSNHEILNILENFNLILMSDNYHQIRINLDYLLERKGYHIGLDFKLIADHLNQELKNFKIIFEKYFEVIVLPLYQNINSNNVNNLFNQIDYHYTFNYTPTFEKIYGKGVTTHLHGEISNINNQLVFGINKIPVFNKSEQKYFIPFTKAFQKINGNSKYSFIDKLENNLNSSMDIIFFMGHSLDSSDKEDIDRVFNYITNSIGELKMIVVIYHNKESRSQLIVNLIDIRGEENIKKLLEKESLIFVQNNSNELEVLLNFCTSSAIDKTRFR